ncbi:MAG: CofH family radical SAM protein [Spirochaetes bacterium]|nr:MAG: CofH family radical SAM protein [Spirochaetota bacterium]
MDLSSIKMLEANPAPGEYELSPILGSAARPNRAHIKAMNEADQNLLRKIDAGERISADDALRLFEWEILPLGLAADRRRRHAVPTERVGFIHDRIINFTNRCDAMCRFCAYHARAGTIEPYEMSLDDILTRVGELAAAGGTQVMLQGGLHPEYTLAYYVEMVRAVKGSFPGIYLHSFSPAEVIHIAGKEHRTPEQVVAALKEAGLDSMPGASDLLIDRIRREVSPAKLTRDEWVGVIRAIAHNGMKSSATMTYGMGETLAERISHLETVRAVQDETGALRAFIPWSFSPARTRMEHIPPATGIDYLKTVAVARIYLDNVVNIQAGWLTEGLKLAQIALAMGANDMGGVLTEEVVVKATGLGAKTNREELIHVIRAAGKIPVERDSDYREIRGFDR